jgi:Uma2 family endonuclease
VAADFDLADCAGQGKIVGFNHCPDAAKGREQYPNKLWSTTMGLARTNPPCTAEEYLALERQSDERHQCVDGHIHAMAGESLEHSTIRFNLAVILGNQLRGKNCRGLSPNMKIRSGPSQKNNRSGMFSYADATVVCGDPRFHDEHRDVLLNPAVIIEVLSPSTEAFDRGDKFLRYRTHLETLSDYVTESGSLFDFKLAFIPMGHRVAVKHLSKRAWVCNEQIFPNAVLSQTIDRIDPALRGFGFCVRIVTDLAFDLDDQF